MINYLKTILTTEVEKHRLSLAEEDKTLKITSTKTPYYVVNLYIRDNKGTVYLSPYFYLETNKDPYHSEQINLNWFTDYKNPLPASKKFSIDKNINLIINDVTPYLLKLHQQIIEITPKIKEHSEKLIRTLRLQQHLTKLLYPKHTIYSLQQRWFDLDNKKIKIDYNGEIEVTEKLSYENFINNFNLKIGE